MRITSMCDELVSVCNLYVQSALANCTASVGQFAGQFAGDFPNRQRKLGNFPRQIALLGAKLCAIYEGLKGAISDEL